jgi:hypothetical protein
LNLRDNNVIQDTNVLLSNKVDKMIMEDGNRLVSNLLSFWKLLKELNDDPEEISDVRKSLIQEQWL